MESRVRPILLSNLLKLGPRVCVAHPFLEEAKSEKNTFSSTVVLFEQMSAQNYPISIELNHSNSWSGFGNFIKRATKVVQVTAAIISIGGVLSEYSVGVLFFCILTAELASYIKRQTRFNNSNPWLEKGGWGGV